MQVEQESLTFGKVFQGGNKRLPLVIRNPSKVETKACIDLSANSAFHLALSKDGWSHSQYAECPLQSRSVGSDGTAQEAMESSDRCAVFLDSNP